MFTLNDFKRCQVPRYPPCLRERVAECIFNTGTCGTVLTLLCYCYFKKMYNTPSYLHLLTLTNRMFNKDRRQKIINVIDNNSTITNVFLNRELIRDCAFIINLNTKLNVEVRIIVLFVIKIHCEQSI